VVQHVWMRWIVRAAALLLLAVVPSVAHAQRGKLTGVITDAASGAPIDGAQIVIEGTGLGALTQENGRFFILNVPVGVYAVTARRIGYPVLLVSATTGEGIPELKQALQGKQSVMVGKSGVGKTSLLNAIQPGLGLRVKAVSDGELGKGRHTTTHLEMFELEFGGALVDTPGIREFGLWNIPAEELAYLFPEMADHIGRCKFGLSCRHDQEPGCAIRKAVMAETISPYRYQSYMNLRREL